MPSYECFPSSRFVSSATIRIDVSLTLFLSGSFNFSSQSTYWTLLNILRSQHLRLLF